MVEPFGCVVMLHWRLHVYGALVPLPAIPPPHRLPPASPLFYTLLFLLHPSTPIQPLPELLYTVQPSTNGRQSVEVECYHWPMCHYCAPVPFRQLHNSYRRGRRSNTAHTRFFIFRADIVRRYEPRFFFSFFF